MHTLPDSFAPEAVTAVDALLDEVVGQEGVAILAAVESGSRAWGFPSPDSDYDCRFVYVRRLTAYLDPWPARDVVERAPDAVLDVNGWDLRKAVGLLVKGNAVITEWIRSPLVYRAVPGFTDEFLALADEVADRALVGRHYQGVGRGQWQRFLSPDGEMPLKKTFYALRPALALRWLDLHPGAAIPPMDLPTLVAGADLPAVVVEAVEALVEQKALGREMRTGPVPPVLRRVVEHELRDRDWLDVRRTEEGLRSARRSTAAYFVSAVERYAPS
ncbi:nucleotidyltransferase domain-containing protein [Cellulomonas sp. URHB0016]